MLFINRMLLGWALLAGSIFLVGTRLDAEEIPAVDIADLKTSPQRYWAGFFVFKDVLQEKPGGTTLRIDKRKITRFRTRELGDVYAEQHLLTRLSKLKLGEEYLLVGTVSQKKNWLGSLFGGLLGDRGKFIVIVKDITMYKKDTGDVPGMMSIIERVNTTNVYNRTLLVLQDIIEVVNEDMFGYASAQNLTLAEAFARPESRDKLGASVRAALRKYEDRNRTSSQELFIQIVMSFIAYQNGLVDLAKPVYEPEPLDPGAPAVLDEGGANRNSPETPESWDLSRQNTVSEPAPTPVVIAPAPVAPKAIVAEAPPEVAKKATKKAQEPIKPPDPPEEKREEAVPGPASEPVDEGPVPEPPGEAGSKDHKDHHDLAEPAQEPAPASGEDLVENTRRVINFQESDLDGDGCITLEEFSRNSILDNWIENREVMAKTVFDRIDADRDGCLTTREFGMIKYQKPMPVR